MTRSALFDTGPRTRWTGTRALAVRQGCPHCGGALIRVAVTQLPLLRGAGYGEAVTIEHESCRCTSRVVRIEATNPRTR